MNQLTSLIHTGLEKTIKAPLRASVKLLWCRNHKNWLIILAYHRVTDKYNPQIHMPLTWNQTTHFEQQIQYLKNNFKIVKLHNALQDISNGSLAGSCVAITIDDGDSSVKSNIAPLLKKYNCPATIFITSSYLDCKQLHFSYIVRYLANSPDPEKRAYINNAMKQMVKQLRMTDDTSEYEKERNKIEKLSKLIPEKHTLFLNKEDIKALDPEIFDIGLHGNEHQRFSMMDAAWQEDAIAKNISALKDLENFCPIFAVPFGSARDWNESTVSACIKYKVAMLTCTGGINLTKDILYKRVFADSHDSAMLINKTITGIF